MSVSRHFFHSTNANFGGSGGGGGSVNPNTSTTIVPSFRFNKAQGEMIEVTPTTTYATSFSIEETSSDDLAQIVPRGGLSIQSDDQVDYGTGDTHSHTHTRTYTL